MTITSRSCILASTSVCFSGKLLLFKLVRCTVVFAFHFASSLAEVTVSKKAHYAKPMGSSLPCLHFPVGAIGALFWLGGFRPDGLLPDGSAFPTLATTFLKPFQLILKALQLFKYSTEIGKLKCMNRQTRADVQTSSPKDHDLESKLHAGYGHCETRPGNCKGAAFAKTNRKSANMQFCRSSMQCAECTWFFNSNDSSSGAELVLKLCV